MRKKNMLLLVLLVAVAVISATALQNPSTKKQVSHEQEATPVQEGVMTKEQRVHSRLFKEQKGIGKKLSEIADEQSDNEGVVVEALPGLPMLSPQGESVSKDTLEKTAGGADAIVIGVVNNKTSQLTETGMFTFTDYDVTVQEVLKSNSSIKAGGQITVTRPGGTVLLNGRTISAIDRTSKPLEVGGRYLLFLQAVPATGAYQAVGKLSAFNLADTNASALTDDPLLPTEFRGIIDASLLINKVRAAVASGSAKQGGVN